MSSNNALSAKIKAIYGRRLNKDDFDELLRKRSVSEIATYLKNTQEYHDVLKDVHENTIHRGQLEVLLKRDNFARKVKLHRFVDVKDNTFYKSSIEIDEIEQILSCIRAIISKDYSNFVSNLPLFMDAYMSFDLKNLLEVKNYKDLKLVLKNTIYAQVINDYLDEDRMNYEDCETALIKFYYSRLRSLARKNKKSSSDILKIIDTQIELKNICKIYRMKKYFNSTPTEIRESMIECNHKINKNTYELLYEANSGERVLELLAASPYKIEVEDNDFIYIEHYSKQYVYQMGKKYINYSTDPNVIYFAYFILEEVEIDNLVNIIEGVRYNVAPSKIESLLIY